MSEAGIEEIVIVGGGTAGWMTAAALSKVLRGRKRIVLVESEEIGTVGVGEATIPMIQRFNQVLEIDEDEFLRETQATFKLGIEFVGWGASGERYIHGFGRIGQDLLTAPFDQYWQRLHAIGQAADLGEYSIARVAALRNKFMRPRTDMPQSPLSEIAYAFHFDASLYARYLRRYAEARGVVRLEGKVAEVRHHEDGGARGGHVRSLVLSDGRRVDGELFIDCSGFRGLLIGETLKVGYEDWTHWLPCDRAVAVPSAATMPRTPYTRATARRAGWQWRIPLQHRTGNGHVFCSRHISEDEATAELMANLDGEALADPRALRFTTGMRERAWDRNVVAIGLSSGFLEPLESTSIHMIQSGISRLLSFFPDRSFAQVDIDEFNRQGRFEYERVRDFIVLHYHLNRRQEPLWRACREMDVPATLEAKMALYRSRGRLVRENNELFAEVAWLQVMHGQGLRAQGHHPLVDLLDEREVKDYLDSVRAVIAQCVDVMPTHDEFLARCASGNLPRSGDRT
ncbi:tryptophan halogenase family protein [Roseateles chitinivorans]|uniref:tryptophan halogenase family protein n=1 Tax=Roseateles chitinivorans TaxID=2917965 RepID=UPI003D670A08